MVNVSPYGVSKVVRSGYELIETMTSSYTGRDRLQDELRRVRVNGESEVPVPKDSVRARGQQQWGLSMEISSFRSKGRMTVVFMFWLYHTFRLRGFVWLMSASPSLLLDMHLRLALTEELSSITGDVGRALSQARRYGPEILLIMR